MITPRVHLVSHRLFLGAEACNLKWLVKCQFNVFTCPKVVVKSEVEIVPSCLILWELLPCLLHAADAASVQLMATLLTWFVVWLFKSKSVPYHSSPSSYLGLVEIILLLRHGTEW